MSINRRSFLGILPGLLGAKAISEELAKPDVPGLTGKPFKMKLSIDTFQPPDALTTVWITTRQADGQLITFKYNERLDGPIEEYFKDGYFIEAGKG